VARTAAATRTRTEILAPHAWELLHPSGVWRTELEYGTAFDEREDPVLSMRGRPFAQLPAAQSVESLASAAPGTFAFHRNSVLLRLARGNAPEEVVLRFRQRVHDRCARGRAVVGGFAGEGFPLAPGQTAECTADLPRDSVLSFFLAHVGLEPGARSSLRVRIDGTLLFSTEVSGGATESGTWHCAPLSGVSRSAARLTFEMEGGPVQAAVLAPGIGRPATGVPERPDIVLFLADTFRADNLAVYGGDPARAPRLNAFARASLVFRNTWSTSTWTLPAQASMLTGLQPEQHGAVDGSRALGEGLVTLAEQLAAHGYRTGGVTDSAFVSREFGLDRGFEWFREIRSWDLRRTLATALEFLRHRDGRPVFLFVHTYRAHAPYRRDAEERAGPFLDGGTGVEELQRRYLQGVQALDERFGCWLDEITSLGPAAPEYVVFTSDHGEAFGEHGDHGHGGAPWETLVRIPMILRGPDLPPEVRDIPASLVDVPRTVAALAGIAPAEPWGGRDLLSMRESQAVYAFIRVAGEPLVALIDDGRKVVAPADPLRLASGEHRGAVDLRSDPGELHLLQEAADWPAELCRKHAARIAALVRPLAPTAASRSTPVTGEQLRNLGY
jgi:arylsulfatase A-like enzyme